MQAYIKHKAYYDKKTEQTSSKLNEGDYVYVLHPKGDHQASKIPFTNFRWTGPYNVEKALPNNKHLIGTDKTQVLHSMRLQLLNPDNPQLTYKIRHKNRNLSLKLSQNTWTCAPELWSANTIRLFLTAIKMTVTYLIQLNSQ